MDSPRQPPNYRYETTSMRQLHPCSGVIAAAPQGIPLRLHDPSISSNWKSRIATQVKKMSFHQRAAGAAKRMSPLR